MIRSIFFPDTFGSYALFGKRIVGFDGDFSSRICATVSYQKGTARTVEKIIVQEFSDDATLTHEQKIKEALTAVAKEIGTVDFVICSLPSTMIIFKELTLPFTSLKKIKSVLPFEVESLLPFTLDKAVIDCVITHKDLGQSDILVCAVQQEFIDRYTDYFNSAALTLNKLSIDLFDLQGVYQLSEPEQKNYCFISSGKKITRIGLVIDGKLVTVRGINKGIDSSVFLEIQRTIDAYRQRYAQRLQEMPLSHCVIQGLTEQNSALQECLEKELSLTTTFFEPSVLIDKKIIQSTHALSDECLISTAASFSSEQFKNFNLLAEQARLEEDRVVSFQLITAGSLVLFIFISFMLYSFLRVRTLKTASKIAQTEAINELKKQVKLKPAQSLNLEVANKAALAELKKQQSAWRNLSEENRYAFLRNLAELSKCINAKEVRLDLVTLHMKDDIIKLYGSVPGYQQLTLLQQQLECPSFKKLPKLQDWNFKTDPITLVLNRQEI